MAKKNAKALDQEFIVIKPKLQEIKNLYVLKDRETQRQEQIDFELSRHQSGIEQRIKHKKDTILMQE